MDELIWLRIPAPAVRHLKPLPLLLFSPTSRTTAPAVELILPLAALLGKTAANGKNDPSFIYHLEMIFGQTVMALLPRFSSSPTSSFQDDKERIEFSILSSSKKSLQPKLP